MSLSTDLSLVSPLSLCVHKGFMGWWKDLRDETEFMPNSHFRELDFIEEKGLFGECKSDLIESGTPPGSVGSFTL